MRTGGTNIGLKSKLAIDFYCNVAAVGLLGVGGLLMNMLIGVLYGPAGLGVFNQAYAVLIVVSQLAALGVHVSVLKHVAEHAGSPEQLSSVVSSGLGLLLLTATLATAGLWLLRGVMARALDSPDMALALGWIVPGLWCFTLNKLLLAALNGMSRMRVFAFFNAARPVLMLATLGALALLEAPQERLTLVFSVAEGVVFIGLCLYVLRCVPWSMVGVGRWVRVHLTFGIKGMAGGLLSELSTRVDVLMLGLFFSDAVVGVYSFAAILVEGMLQLPFVLRRIMDPMLTRLYVSGDRTGMRTLARKAVGWSFLGMGAVFGLALLCYHPGLELLSLSDQFAEAFGPFIVLCAGALVYAAYLPVSGVLIQSGFPGKQTLFVLLTCLTNVVLNLVLVPNFGMLGAAVATSATFAATVLYLKYMTKRIVGIRV